MSRSVKCVKFLVRQGLASSRYDENESLLNKGNYLELLNVLAENFEEVGGFEKCPKNCKLNAPETQRKIANCCFCKLKRKTS